MLPKSIVKDIVYVVQRSNYDHHHSKCRVCYDPIDLRTDPISICYIQSRLITIHRTVDSANGAARKYTAQQHARINSAVSSPEETVKAGLYASYTYVGSVRRHSFIVTVKMVPVHGSVATPETPMVGAVSGNRSIGAGTSDSDGEESQAEERQAKKRKGTGNAPVIDLSD